MIAIEKLKGPGAGPAVLAARRHKHVVDERRGHCASKGAHLALGTPAKYCVELSYCTGSVVRCLGATS